MSSEVRRDLSGIPTSGGDNVCLLRYPGLAAGSWDSTLPAPVAHPLLKPRAFISHNDIGLNYIECGEIRVLLSTGYRYVHRPGQLSVYWGAIPHRVDGVGAPKTRLYWLSLPLGIFLRWSISRAMTESLIRGRVFIEDDEAGQPDLLRMQRWQADLESGPPAAEPIVLLELEARLRRLACNESDLRRVPTRLAPAGPDRNAERMLLLIAERFRDEELSASTVAAAVDLNPDYAGRVFRRSIGMSINEYITECRVAHAKALLATGDAAVLQVAMDSGFGSSSQFHDVFKRLAGCTPQKYRTGLRAQ